MFLDNAWQLQPEAGCPGGARSGLGPGTVMKLGVPTLVSYELLDRLLESAERGTVRPSGYVIIDNGGLYSRARAEAIVAQTRAVSLEFVAPRVNLGVAASWNVILDLAGDEAVVIANDDVVLGPEMFGEMSRALERALFVSGVGWALFGQTPECTRLVGPYDENFWPAYFEDVDYEIRLRRAGVTPVYPLSTGMEHALGSTTQRLGHAWISGHVERNRRYLVAKWGGDSAQTARYREPFDGRPPPGWSERRRFPRYVKPSEPAALPVFAVVALGERREMVAPLAADLVDQVTELLVVDNRPDLGALDLPRAAWLPNPEGRLHAAWNLGLDTASDLATQRRTQRWATLVLNDDVRIGDGAVSRLVTALDVDPTIWATYPDLRGVTSPQRPVVITADGSLTGRTHTGWCICHRGEKGIRYDEAYEFWFGDDQIERDIRSAGGQVAAVHGVKVVHLEPDAAVERSPELQQAILRDRQLFFARNS